MSLLVKSFGIGLMLSFWAINNNNHIAHRVPQGMVFVEGGVLRMGNPKDAYSYQAEQPVHAVNL